MPARTAPLSTAHSGTTCRPASSKPAHGVETAVAVAIHDRLRDCAQHHDLLTAALKAIKADGIATSAPLIKSGTIARGRLAITLRGGAVAALAACPPDAIAAAAISFEARSATP